MTDRQIKEATSPGDFIFHEQWMPIFRSFSPEMAGRIIHAVIDYLNSGALPDDQRLRDICLFLFAHIDADRKRIEQAAPARRKSKKAAANETSADTAPSNESPAADNQKTASEEAPSVQFKAKDAQRKNDSGKNNAPARTNARADDIKPKYSGLADLLVASGLIGKAPDRPV